MSVTESYLQYIQDQLSEFGDFRAKKMFGGYGLFKESLMFGMIGNDILRLKVDDVNRPDFEARGMKAYQSSSKKKGMPYWEVPVDVIEDRAELCRWAEEAYGAAVRGKK